MSATNCTRQTSSLLVPGVAGPGHLRHNAPQVRLVGHGRRAEAQCWRIPAIARPISPMSIDGAERLRGRSSARPRRQSPLRTPPRGRRPRLRSRRRVRSIPQGRRPDGERGHRAAARLLHRSLGHDRSGEGAKVHVVVRTVPVPRIDERSRPGCREGVSSMIGRSGVSSTWNDGADAARKEV